MHVTLGGQNLRACLDGTTLGGEDRFKLGKVLRQVSADLLCDIRSLKKLVEDNLQRRDKICSTLRKPWTPFELYQQIEDVLCLIENIERDCSEVKDDDAREQIESKYQDRKEFLMDKIYGSKVADDRSPLFDIETREDHFSEMVQHFTIHFASDRFQQPGWQLKGGLCSDNTSIIEEIRSRLPDTEQIEAIKQFTAHVSVLNESCQRDDSGRFYSSLHQNLRDFLERHERIQHLLDNGPIQCETWAQEKEREGWESSKKFSCQVFDGVTEIVNKLRESADAVNTPIHTFLREQFAEAIALLKNSFAEHTDKLKALGRFDEIGAKIEIYTSNLGFIQPNCVDGIREFPIKVADRLEEYLVAARELVEIESHQIESISRLVRIIVLANEQYDRVKEVIDLMSYNESYAHPLLSRDGETTFSVATKALEKMAPK